MADSESVRAGKGIRIIVDHREARNGVFYKLKGFGARVEKGNLDVGDYICSGRLCVERKTVPDFLQSIIDKRIFDQAERMRECFEKPLIIIEGNPDLLFLERHIHPNVIRGTLASLSVDSGVPMIWTSNEEETASQIYWLAYRDQAKKRNPPSIRSPRKVTDVRKYQEYMISGLPHVNSKLSRRLLEKFKSPRKVFSASPENLMEVRGIGKEKAKRIWEMLNEKYGDEKGG